MNAEGLVDSTGQDKEDLTLPDLTPVALVFAASRYRRHANQLAAQLRPCGILVNSVDPGFTATDLNAHQRVQTVEQAAAAPVRLALIDDDGPSGGYFSAEGALPW